jgi:hypothetical protein
LLHDLRQHAVVVTTQGNVKLSATLQSSIKGHDGLAIDITAAAGGGGVKPEAGKSSSGHLQGQQQSSSVYLPADMTPHGMDWQQDLPQLSWRIVAAAYQQQHPDLPWAEWFSLLGVQSLPPVVRRQATHALLQQKQQEAAGDLAGTTAGAVEAANAINDTSSGGGSCQKKAYSGPTAVVPITVDSGSGSHDQLVIDWCCPDLEAVLAAMPLKHLEGSSSSSTFASQSQAASRQQHDSMCK